jgi:geranylgeranyl diphosphate synthase type II
LKQENSLSSLEIYFRKEAEKIETALDEFLPKPAGYPSELHEAMRYSVLNGGKRIRPLLVLAICEMFQGDSKKALIPACSVELVHCYSLIHDDLPCLDNDELRRGKPTCHKKYGESIALLAGDALLTFAFELLSRMDEDRKAVRILKELSHAAGAFGMVGGQVTDILSVGREIDFPTLDYIHIHKTGQLIRASCLIGAIQAGVDQKSEAHIVRFGEYLGFAFQIVDDILDADGYTRFMSEHDVKLKADELIRKAKKELDGLPGNERLIEIADFVLTRRNK